MTYRTVPKKSSLLTKMLDSRGFVDSVHLSFDNFLPC